MNLFSTIYVLLAISFTHGKTAQEKCSPEDREETNLADKNVDSVKVLVYKVETKIRLRYSETAVTTILQNTHVSKMAYYPWKVVIPKLAFLSGFHFFYVSLEFNAIEGTVSVKNRNESRSVSMWVRNANIFSVDLQIRPLSEVQAFISYGEVLERNLGYYQQNVYILPEIVQSAKSLIITTEIKESDEIKFIRIPFSKDIQDAAIVHKTANHTKVIWNPDVYKIVNLKCSVSQYSVQYDVRRNRGGSNGNGNSGLDGDDYGDDDGNGGKKGSGNKGPNAGGINGTGGGIGNKGGGAGNSGKGGANGSNGGANNGAGGGAGNSGKEGANGSNNGGNSANGTGGGGSGKKNGTIDGNNGYRNGSKSGDALNSGDILVISNYLFHFLVPVDLKSLRKHLIFVQDVSGSMNGRKLEQMKNAMMKTLSDLKSDEFFNIITFNGQVKHWKTESSTIAADSKNISRAKDFVNKLEAGGRTAIKGSLEETFKLINEIDESQTLPDNVKSIVVFMTDGLPTDSNVSDILLATQKLNRNLSISIHALGFGNEADMSFLKSLALQNFGLSRQIFEGTDAADQLKSFYNEISTPVLTDVTISYSSPDFTVTGLSITNFTTVFGGKEIKVTGKIVPKVPGRGPFKLTVIIKGNSRRGPVTIKKVVSIFVSPNATNSFSDKNKTTENTTGSTNDKRKQTRPGQGGSAGGRNSTNKGNNNNRGGSSGSGGGNSGASGSSGSRGGNSGTFASSQVGSPNRRNKFQHLPTRGSVNGEEDYVNKIWTQITMQQLIDSYLKSGNSSLLDELRKLALQNGIVTPYTSMTTRFTPCSPKVLLDPVPVEAIDGTNCSFGKIIQPLESIRWFNPKLPVINIDGVVYNISLSRQEIDNDSVAGQSCSVKTKTTHGNGTCQHLLDCPQTDFKDNLDIYKDNYFCPIKLKRSKAARFAGSCCLSLD